MADFTYKPSPCVPFRDPEAVDRCRQIKRSEIEQHENPDFRIRVVPDEDLMYMWQADVVRRLKETREAGKPCVMLMPNPYPGYRHLARLINALRLDCSHAWFFAMDEYADHEGNEIGRASCRERV
jgi:glucosamine-6-phosphate deaminase